LSLLAAAFLAFLIVGTMNGNDITGSGGSGGPTGSGTTAGGTFREEGTNVVRVPFGVRQARRRRPERPDHWATLVLPFQAGGGSHPTPPQAA
jgi:hypothetical protein